MPGPVYPHELRRPRKIDASPIKEVIRGRVFPNDPRDRPGGSPIDEDGPGGLVPRRVPAQLADGIFEGGGALGAAYIGALRFLGDNNIWFARVAGNSAGSITAAMIAAGFNAMEIQWLSSGFPGKPAPPSSLVSCEITEPINFKDFLDLTKLEQLSDATIKKTILFRALKFTVIDELGKMRVPFPTQKELVNAATKGILNNGVIGAGIQAAPRGPETLQSVLNLALTPLPDEPLTLSQILPNTEPLREKLALDLWRLVARAVPLEVLLTSLIYEATLFRGEVFLQTMSELFSRKIHRKPNEPVKFRHLKIPLAVIATNIMDGSMEVYSSKTTPDFLVVEAVRRSMSVPIVFQSRSGAPTGEAGKQFVDGGLCSNFPAWLFAPGNAQYFDSSPRPKIGFRLEESLAENLAWGVQPAKFSKGGVSLNVDDAQVIIPLLADILNIDIPDLAPGGDPDEDQPSPIRLIREISACVGLDKEVVTHHQIVKGLMGDATYFDVRLPLRGYHWLDFDINSDEDHVLSMWTRAWHATRDALRAAPMTGNGSFRLVADTGSPYRDG